MTKFDCRARVTDDDVKIAEAALPTKSRLKFAVARLDLGSALSIAGSFLAADKTVLKYAVRIRFNYTDNNGFAIANRQLLVFADAAASREAFITHITNQAVEKLEAWAADRFPAQFVCGVCKDCGRDYGTDVPKVCSDDCPSQVEALVTEKL